MPKINRYKYTAEEQERYDAAYNLLLGTIDSAKPDDFALRRELNAALAGHFPIDWPDVDGWTLVRWAATSKNIIKAGMLQLLIKAGADVNVKDDNGRTPLGRACELYICDGEDKYTAVIDMLLTAGAQPELDESWKADQRWHWGKPERRARRDWLDAYIKTWQARGRAEDAAPAFDYAL